VIFICSSHILSFLQACTLLRMCSWICPVYFLCFTGWDCS